MRKIWLRIALAVPLSLIGAVAAFGQEAEETAATGGCDAFKARNALKVETDPGILENFRLPIWTWPGCEGAVSYNIFVNDTYQASTEGQTTWQPTSEFAFGSYTSYIVAVMPDQTTVTSQSVQFRIGIAPATPVSPNDGDGIGTWCMTPVFKFKGSKGAMAYSVEVVRASGTLKICEKTLDTPEGRDGAEIKEYTCPMPEGQRLEPGEQASWRVKAWTIVDGVGTNVVESDKPNVRVRKLNPPTNIAPNNGFSVVVRNPALDIPSLEWTHELVGQEDVVLEMHFLTKESKGVPNPDVDPLLTEANVMQTTWDGKDELEPGHEYRWYAVARKKDPNCGGEQTAIGEVWVFNLKNPIGLDIGLKLGGNMARTTNPLARQYFGGGGGLYVAQRLFRKSIFTLKIQLDALVETRSVAFKQKDNPEFIVENLHITHLTLFPSLYIKPMFRLAKFLDLYALAGAEGSFNIVSRIINNNATERIVNQTPWPAFNIVGALGVEFNFDVKYLFGRNLQLAAEVRYTHSVTTSLKKETFLGAKSSNLSMFQLYIVNKIIDF